MTLNQYISKHLVVQIGHPVSGYAYTDIIVDNPVGLVEFVDNSMYYICGVLWWEKVYKGNSPQLGTGGIVDPRDPSNVWLAETFLSYEFEKDASRQDYLQYLKSIQQEYPEIPLYPSFDIAFR